MSGGGHDAAAFADDAREVVLYDTGEGLVVVLRRGEARVEVAEIATVRKRYHSVVATELTDAERRAVTEAHQQAVSLLELRFG